MAWETIVRNWLRRIRGVLGMGVTWAIAWSGAGMALAAAMRFKADAPFPIIFGVLGFFAGVIFSGLIVLTEGRRRFDQISLPRFAAWGAMGGVLLSAVFAKAASLDWGDVVVIVPAFALASAVCAAGSLALAKRARRQELLDVRGDATNAELTDHVKPTPLGGG